MLMNGAIALPTLTGRNSIAPDPPHARRTRPPAGSAIATIRADPGQPVFQIHAFLFFASLFILYNIKSSRSNYAIQEDSGFVPSNPVTL